MQTLEKHRDVITSTDFERLLAHRDEPSISLYMPTYRQAPEDQQNPIRFNNLVNEVKIQLTAQGYDDEVIEELLVSLQQPYLGEGIERFWQHMSDGLALFVAPKVFAYYRLPYTFEEFVYVSDRFHIRQLLPIVLENEMFYVMTLNAENVNLYRATQHQMAEVKLPEDTPRSLSDALKYDEAERQVQYHSTANHGHSDQNALFHGQGSASSDEYKQENIKRFFKMLDNAICSLLNEEGKPLIIAGVDSLRGAYRDVNHYNWLLDEDIDSDPQALDLKALHHQAWSIVQTDIQRIFSRELSMFKQLQGNDDDRAETNMKEIIPAAYYQRIDTLFVSNDMVQWGDFKPDNNELTLHEHYQMGDHDLINDAAIQTLVNGGIVHTLDSDRLLEDNQIAAILRY